MDTPDPWVFLLLAGASYRIWRLLAEDTLLDAPRRALVRLPRDWEEGRAIPAGYRYRLAEFINCPWCLGFWVSLAVWLAWQLQATAAEVVSVPLAISTVVGLIRTRLDVD